MIISEKINITIAQSAMCNYLNNRHQDMAKEISRLIDTINNQQSKELKAIE